MSNFWIGFIIGCFIGGIVGILGAALCAVSGRASRAEERGDCYKPPPGKSRRPNKPTPAPPIIKVVTQNNPRTD